MTVLVLVFAAASTFAAILGFESQAASGASAAVKKCSVVSAGGHKYTVSATSVSCAFAGKWVAALAGKRLKPHAVEVPLSGGPPGFDCRGGTKGVGVDMPDVQPNVQVSGNCSKGLGLGNSPYFNWVVESKY